MSRLVNSAESWENVYTAFQNINFAAFDFATIKQSILDYVKLYYPETFNDFIESSEFIAVVETFAYIAELLAYRLDINAHENFISTAQRQDSILRLAKFISYRVARPIPARGLVKLTSVTTTEPIIDTFGNNLANIQIRWNDISNSNWKNQFILVMNQVLEQNFGTVLPSDRFQIQDVLFELYALNTTPLPTGVVTYSASASGQTAPMELVPVAYDTTLGIIERRPYNQSAFTLLYANDGMGDSSDTTGFMCYTKQGTLQKFSATFDGVTPNQVYDVSAININDIDIWVNNIDPVTGATLNNPSTLPYLPQTTTGITGEWVEVDVTYAQNVIFNTNPQRNKYETETLANNSVRLIFGDGEFADIPAGTFDIWVRTSLDQDIVVPQNAVVDTSASFTYVDPLGRTQTFKITFSLISSLQNASASETIDHVRNNAPGVYYTQNRMVNGEDYNTFMMQDSSILKLRALNRTFAGDSKYITWHDASGAYENTKIFGDDGIVYYAPVTNSITTPVVDVNTLITTYIQPLLSSTDITTQILAAGVPANVYRRIFSTAETNDIVAATAGVLPVSLYYNIVTYDWHAIPSSTTPAVAFGVNWPSQFITTPLIVITQPSLASTSYVVTRNTTQLVFQSPSTSFWNTNNASKIIEYSTLDSTYDTVNVLQANLNCNKNSVLQKTWPFYVLGQENIIAGPNLGLPDVTKLSILPVDTSGSGVPQGLNIYDSINFYGLADFITPKYNVDVSSITIPYVITLPISYVVGQNDITVTGNNAALVPGVDWIEAVPNVGNTITIFNVGTNTSLLIVVNEYVYFTRPTTADDWSWTATTPEALNSWYDDSILYPTPGTGLWTRYSGTSKLNFSWFHFSPIYYLVDPSPSNINDVFMITKGYYLSTKTWLENNGTVPVPPTPFDLTTAYSYLTGNKMISDEVVLHSGDFKILFGSKAEPSLQATFMVIRSTQQLLTDNQVKTVIVTTVRNFFNITQWEFGETFYFTELAAAIHMALPVDISSVVLVPVLTQNYFGTMFEVVAGENEIFLPDITVDNIQIVTGYTSTNLNQA